MNSQDFNLCPTNCTARLAWDGRLLGCTQDRCPHLEPIRPTFSCWLIGYVHDTPVNDNGGGLAA